MTLSAVTANDFSRARLGALFQRATDRGYRSVLFGEEDEADSNTAQIFWRHDIDLEIPAMVALAEVEAEHRIRATYFLMVRSWFYNLFSWEGGRAIERLGQLGHAVGLHCDLGLARDGQAEDPVVEDRVARDFALVDREYPGVFRRVVSFHNPPRCVLRRSFSGFYSTYQEKFFTQIKYLSDSNRHWREGPPEAWLDPARHRRLSILLHPAIWAYPGQTMPEGMVAYLRNQSNRCREKLIQDDIEVGG